MARWGSFKWGTAQKWGYAGLTAAQATERAVVGGTAPWLPAQTVPYRAACVALYRFDIGTWSAGAEFPDFVGGSRSATFDGIFQTETLTATLADAAAYLPGGARAAWVAEGQAVQPRWTLVGAGGTVTVYGCVYVLNRPLDRDNDAQGGQPLTIQAVDWLQARTAGTFSQDGYTTNAAIRAALADGLAAGAPVPGAGTGWSDALAAIIYQYGEQLQVDSWPSPALPAAPDPEDETFIVFGEAPVLLTSPGQRATVPDFWRYFGRYVAFRLVYTDGGVPYLRLRAPLYSAGWTLSTDSAIGGGLPVPWESYDRRFGAPPYRKLTYTRAAAPIANVAAGTSATALLTEPAPPLAVLTSWHPQFPYGDASQEREVVDPWNADLLLYGGARSPTAPFGASAGFAHPQEWARWELARALGEADVVTLTLDSAFPFPQLGLVARLYDDCTGMVRLDGLYEIVSVNQPLGLAPQTVTLHWRGGN